jgi:hypothetical protein
MSVATLPPQGLIFVIRDVALPMYLSYPVPVYIWTTLPPGDINTGVYPSRLGVGRGADNLTL